jgi:hypothetical protein
MSSVTGKDKDKKHHYSFVSQLDTVKRKIVKRQRERERGKEKSTLSLNYC